MSAPRVKASLPLHPGQVAAVVAARERRGRPEPPVSPALNRQEGPGRRGPPRARRGAGAGGQRRIPIPWLAPVPRARRPVALHLAAALELPVAAEAVGSG